MRARLCARSRLHPLLAVGVLLAACEDAERALVSSVDGPRFSVAAASGLKGTIAFHSNRNGDFDIYTMNADGTGVTQLTNNAFPEFDPIWSPDGKRLAFGRYDGVDFEVVVINADGSGETLLTTNDFVNDFPNAWSPDGKRLAFNSDRADGHPHIFVMNADGTGISQLTSGDFVDDDPVWSPDGKQIAFHSTRAGGDEEIFVMNADGTQVTELTFNDGIFDAVPAWIARPSGEALRGRIAFNSDRDGGGDQEIFTMNADGSGITQL